MKLKYVIHDLVAFRRLIEENCVFETTFLVIRNENSLSFAQMNGSIIHFMPEANDSAGRAAILDTTEDELHCHKVVLVSKGVGPIPAIKDFPAERTEP